MATQPPQYLQDAILAEQRRRRHETSQTAKSILPAVAAGMSGGYPAAYATAMQFHPRPAPVSPLDSIRLQESILDKMGNVQKDQLTGLSSLAGQMKADNEAFKAMLTSITGMYGAKAGAAATLGAASINAGQDIYNRLIETLEKNFEQSSTVNAAGFTRNFEEIRDQMLGDPSVVGGKDVSNQASLTNKLFEIVTEQSQLPNGGPTVAALLAAIDASRGAVGQPGILDELNRIKAQSGADPATIDKIDVILKAAADNATDYQKASSMALQAANEARKEYVQYHLDKAPPSEKEAWGKVLAVADKMQVWKLDNPEERAATLKGLIASISPNNNPSASADEYMRLLGEAANVTTTSPQSAYEFREALYQNKQFQDWARENGFKTNEVALKALWQRTVDQHDKDVLADRLHQAENRRNGVTVKTGPPTPNRGAFHAAAHQRLAPGEPFFADGGGSDIWYVDAAGNARVATDEDLKELSAIAAAEGKDPSLLIHPQSDLTAHLARQQQIKGSTRIEQARNQVNAATDHPAKGTAPTPVETDENGNPINLPLPIDPDLAKEMSADTARLAAKPRPSVATAFQALLKKHQKKLDANGNPIPDEEEADGATP